MEDDEACNTKLRLGLGLGDYVPRKKRHDEKAKPVVSLDLAFAMRPKQEAMNVDHKADRSSFKKMERDHEYPSKENGSNNNKKDGGRKKLRLSKEQSSLLEDSFKIHSTLTPAQKQALSQQLNLKPRQVEVWFQNRRARTKLKQTEVDCEFLKKCCESLSEENKRLKKELQELRSLKVGPSPLYIQIQKAATLTMCTSCEKSIKANEVKGNEAVFDVVRKNNNKLQSGLDGSN
ncbi:homeobox-leucine zipper protein HOX17-like [Quercus robur]|uniref:homeobox-leucine zipper protein HOX17-like n=1 Tax=Quercus robur TaxID=38942 RepID=UPI002162FB63|nr:homeobox-leucine zipper protein HOX17-like [Quercus robur]